MRRACSVVRGWICLIVIAVPAASASASISFGEIRGTVVTPSGSPIGNAEVTLFTPEADRTFVTGVDGRFFIAQISEGIYIVQATAAGFETVIRSGVEVDPGRATELRFTLDAVPDRTVTLEEETSLLDRRSAVAATRFTRDFLRLLPRFDDLRDLVVESADLTGDPEQTGAGLQPSLAPAAEVHFRLGRDELPVVTTRAAAALLFDLPNLDQVTIVSSATDPSASSAPTVVAVTGRGDADVRGSAFAFFSPHSARRGVPDEARPYMDRAGAVSSQWSAGLAAGGPAIRDSVWWFATAARKESEYDVPLYRDGGRFLVEAERLQNERIRIDSRWSERLSAALIWTKAVAGYSDSGGRTRTELSSIRPMLLLTQRSVVRLGWSRSTEDDATDPRGSFRLDRNALDMSGSLMLGGEASQELSFGFETDDSSYRAAGVDQDRAVRGIESTIAGAFVMDRFAFDSLAIDLGFRLHSEEISRAEPFERVNLAAFLPRVALLWSPERGSDVFSLRYGRYAGRVDRCFQADGASSCRGLPAPGNRLFDSALQTPVIDEVSAGWEREIAPRFLVGAGYTARRGAHLPVIVREDSGQTFVKSASGSADARLAEIHAIRRLSSGLLLSGFVSWRDGEVDGNDERLLEQAIRSGWAWRVSAAVQIPLIAVGVGAVVSSAEGTEIPLLNRRLDDRFQVDLRLSRRFAAMRAPLEVILEIFNLTNHESTTGRAVTGVGVPSGAITAMQNPATLRLGIQVEF